MSLSCTGTSTNSVRSFMIDICNEPLLRMANTMLEAPDLHVLMFAEIILISASLHVYSCSMFIPDNHFEFKNILFRNDLDKIANK